MRENIRGIYNLAEKWNASIQRRGEYNIYSLGLEFWDSKLAFDIWHAFLGIYTYLDTTAKTKNSCLKCGARTNQLVEINVTNHSSRDNLKVTSRPIYLLVFSFMVVIYILSRLKTLNSRHFKCVSHPLVFYITAITRLQIM